MDDQHGPRSKTLPSSQLTEVDPSHKRMGIETGISSARDVAKAQQIQLFEATTSSDVHGKEDWKRDDAADEADGGRDPQEAKKQVTIDGLMIEHVGIRNLEESAEPIEESLGEFW